MRNARTRLLCALGLIALIAPAPDVAGQEINPLVRERIVVQLPQQQQQQQDHRSIRVQVGISFFAPGPTNDGEEASKVRDRARRSIYEMAGHECGLLLDTIASECRLDTIGVNVNRQMGQGQGEGFIANGQLTYQITPK